MHMFETDRRTLLCGAAAGMAIAPAFATSDAAATPETLAPRQRIPFDFGWRFSLGHAADVNRDFGFGRDQKTFAKQGQGVAAPAAVDFDDSTWQAINLPHDWALDLPFAKNEYFIPPNNPEDGDPGAGHGYKALGRKFPENSVGWYRKVFTLEKADEPKRLTLEFDGIFRDATIILNGYVLKRHESGYTPVGVDISNFIDVEGPNVLLVRVDATLGEGWFYEGAGIYRHVWLVKSDRLHIPQWGVWAHGETFGQVALETRVANAGEAARRFELVSTLQDGGGKTVAVARTTLEVDAFAEVTARQSALIPSPHLWSLDDPHLYTRTFTPCAAKCAAATR
jgi:beta-galactosidase